jgi:hypothetical protein
MANFFLTQQSILELIKNQQEIFSPLVFLSKDPFCPFVLVFHSKARFTHINAKAVLNVASNSNKIQR